MAKSSFHYRSIVIQVEGVCEIKVNVSVRSPEEYKPISNGAFRERCGRKNAMSNRGFHRTKSISTFFRPSQLEMFCEIRSTDEEACIQRINIWHVRTTLHRMDKTKVGRIKRCRTGAQVIKNSTKHMLPISIDVEYYMMIRTHSKRRRTLQS